MLRNALPSISHRWNLNALLFGAIVASGAIPRALRLTGGLDYDETFASRVKLVFSPSGLAWILYDTHPPLYNSIMLLWNHLFGDSELSLRVFPFLCSLAAILVAAAIARAVAGHTEALVLALMMALSGAGAYYAHEARSYSFIVLLFLLMVHFLLRYRRSGDTKHFCWFVLFSFLCSISHLYSMVFVLSLTATLIWRVATPRNIVALARLGLLQLVLLAPFYFSIVLMTLFTKEHAYLSNFTERFGGPQIGEIFSFFLFGYAGLNRYWLIHVLALVLFVLGLTMLVRRHGERPPDHDLGTADHSFTFRGMSALFAVVVTLAIVISAGLSVSPWFIHPTFFVTLFPNQEHALLMSQMVRLVSRTAGLYLFGYVLALVVWWLVGAQPITTWLKRPVSGRGNRPPGLPQWRQVVLLFPLLGFIPIVVLSHLRPSYNPRYMLAVLPFVLLSMAGAIAGMPVLRFRLLAVTVLGLAQVYSFTQQGPAYALHKADYRAAIRYLYESGRSQFPVASTAPWEAQNLCKYYAGRFQQPELRLVSPLDLPEFSAVSLLVPDLVPLAQDRFADIQDMIRGASRMKEVRFPGITVYELDRRVP